MGGKFKNEGVIKKMVKLLIIRIIVDLLSANDQFFVSVIFLGGISECFVCYCASVRIIRPAFPFHLLDSSNSARLIKLTVILAGSLTCKFLQPRVLGP